MATGIRDKVTILGMGCSRFGERWDAGSPDLTEVHDGFSITALVTTEDLFLSDDGRAVFDALDGKFDRDGAVPCRIDGGFKCFGHPIGASGLRMACEVYSQLLGRAGERQLGSPSMGLTHDLGGVPYQGVAAISILGLH